MEHKTPTIAPTSSSRIPISAGEASKLKTVDGREPNKEAQLRQDLRDWAMDETGDWDLQVAANRSEMVRDRSNSDLWDSMPELDSKTVARSSLIFERYLGRPLDIRLIRSGGYQSIDDMIDHLVPEMMKKIS